MKQLLEIAMAIIFALVLFAAFSYISVYLIQAINVFSLVVIYYASSKDEIHGACLGTVCGLIQDSFSLGVFGVAGIAKTIMGFTAGFVAKRINVVPASRNFVFIFIMITLELILWASLYSFVYSKGFTTGRGVIFLQPLVTALIGTALFPFVRKTIKSVYGQR
jgi:rod shape-determining protein MreD